MSNNEIQEKELWDLMQEAAVGVDLSAATALARTSKKGVGLKWTGDSIEIDPLCESSDFSRKREWERFFENELLEHRETLTAIKNLVVDHLRDDRGFDLGEDDFWEKELDDEKEFSTDSGTGRFIIRLKSRRLDGKEIIVLPEGASVPDDWEPAPTFTYDEVSSLRDREVSDEELSDILKVKKGFDAEVTDG